MGGQRLGRHISMASRRLSPASGAPTRSRPARCRLRSRSSIRHVSQAGLIPPWPPPHCRTVNPNVCHLVSAGGWNAPHPDVNFTGEQWWEVWRGWNEKEVARPNLGWAGFDGCAAAAVMLLSLQLLDDAPPHGRCSAVSTVSTTPTVCGRRLYCGQAGLGHRGA